MLQKKPRRISPYADRMGRFVGQLRTQEGITLKELSYGLCGYLNKIENGERQTGKLLMDAFFQRLGQPVGFFGRILSHREFVKWTQRQEMISQLHAGNIGRVRELAGSYQADKSCSPERQFLAIVEIDCLALSGMPARELLPLVENALRMTQPDFGKVPPGKPLLSQNEERLLAAISWLREEPEKCEHSGREAAPLLIPCDEPGYVYCVNQVIRSRRALLGFSQEDLSDDACGVRSVSRIENEDRKLQRKNRKQLLHKVNLSGERYDCEIISECYEDCILSREVDRAINARDAEEARRLLGLLRRRLPKLPTNRQYILKTEVAIMGICPETDPDRVPVSERRKLLEDALHLTLPLDFGKIDSLPAGILSINEFRILLMMALCHREEGNRDKVHGILVYITRCMKMTATDPAYYADLYARVTALRREQENSTTK